MISSAPQHTCNEVIDMSDQQAPKLKTLFWAFKLLECFDQEHRRRSVTELSKLTSIPKSSVWNALQTFEQLGYVRKHGATGQYSLGPKTLCLYHAYCATNSDAMLYQRECRILSDRTNAIVHVGARVDDKLICLANAYPARYSQTTLPGGAFPFHASAIGKSILAFMDESQKERILADGLPSFTRSTIINREKLEENLKIVRRRDYAVDFMEYEYGMCSVAVPLWRNNSDHTQVPKYAISMTVPAEKLTDDQVLDYVKIIRDTHKEIRMQISADT